MHEYRADVPGLARAAGHHLCRLHPRLSGRHAGADRARHRTVQRELPVDLLEFFILTPLPGSADHQELYRHGVWMDPDMNKYDLEHVTTAPSGDDATQSGRSSTAEAWDLYYSPEHIETHLPPRQGIRHQAGAAAQPRPAILFHLPVRRTCIRCRAAISAANCAASAAPACRAKTRSSSIRGGSGKSSKPTCKLAAYYWYLHRIRRRVERDPAPYEDPALVMGRSWSRRKMSGSASRKRPRRRRVK